jgi:hypothetical protein
MLAQLGMRSDKLSHIHRLVSESMPVVLSYREKHRPHALLVSLRGRQAKRSDHRNESGNLHLTSAQRLVTSFAHSISPS